MRIVLGFALAFMIGVMCRIGRIPSPAPQALIGSLLVVTMSLGYIAAERWLQIQKAGVPSTCSVSSSRTMARGGELQCK